MSELEASLLAAEIGRNPAPGLSHAEPFEVCGPCGTWCVRVYDDTGDYRHMYSASDWLKSLRRYREWAEEGGTAG